MAELNTTGGLLVSHTLSAGNTNPTVVKAVPGRLYRVLLSNINAAARSVHFHDTASAPTAGTTAVKFTILMPAASSQLINFGEEGVKFTAGIAFTTTTELTDTGTTGISANESTIDVFYL